MAAQNDKGLKPLGELLPKLVERFKPPTLTQERLLSMLAKDDEVERILI